MAGNDVGRFLSAQWTEGVNLGNATPGGVWKHGQSLPQAIEATNRIVHWRFRGGHLANIPDWRADVVREPKPAIWKNGWSRSPCPRTR